MSSPSADIALTGCQYALLVILMLTGTSFIDIKDL
nr:MAG TPA: hypothetical protein [Bacteriophage sp.]